MITTTRIFRSILFIAIATTLLSLDLPSGWFKAGSKPDSYEMGIDQGSGMDGKSAATIKAKSDKIEGFGTLMQQIKPDKYLGKRIKMKGMLKTENADGAALWLRVDQAGSERPLSFDNMGDRTVSGTTKWNVFEIVLDVPKTASLIAYGALLRGNGQLWFDNITFEVVEKTVQPTGKINNGESNLKSEPSNLDFEK